MFVRDKNTQKLETAYLIQLFSLIPKDLVSVWKIQRPPNECHFSIFNFVPLHNFFVYFIFFNGSQISRKNHATSTCDDFVFIIFVNQPMRSKSDSKWKMASIINQAEKSIFQIRKICCIKIYFTYKVIILSGPIFQIDFKLYVSFVYMKLSNLAKKKVGRAVWISRSPKRRTLWDFWRFSEKLSWRYK